MMPEKQILVVEDNMINREILCEILSDQYRVLKAENGQEALDLLNCYRDDIALILLDVMMPAMDGYTFLDRIKADPELSLVPVIVMTQSDNESDEVVALSHGATDFVPKPYRPQVILHRVAGLINLRETAAMVNQFQHDRLTGVYSKEFFYQKAQELLSRNPEVQYDMICSNIENFKLFNDLFGVAAGDSLLREIAKIYMGKAQDREICGRLSADRFMCLCERRPEYTNDFFQDLVTGINSRLETGNNVIVKWGIYEISDRSVPVEQMCDRALLAADSVRGQYNKYFSFYDDELRSKLLREQAITETMEAALAEGQFAVYLQPKYSLEGDMLAGAEALVRWNHPELGFISPGEFIPLFEKNGFITRLDRYMWDRVCALIGEWKDKGYTVFPVSVNVSRADVYQADLAEVLMDLVRKYGISPSELHLEITESAYTENAGQIISTVEHLRKLGFIIEMDDFGSGYSSLNMLNQMKIDILKLDMKFIQSETAKPVDQGILRFIVGLARWMNLSVVAEGVETREQLERLREIGCDYVQGYFFAKPMPSAEFEKLLKEQREGKTEHVFRESDKGFFRPCLLVVDEDGGYRDMVRRCFETQYQILEACDVQGALGYISEKGRDIFTVILSMTMPGQGGFTVLKALGENQLAWRIPVLATGPQDEQLEKTALKLDADDFACKPHAPYSLQKRVSRLRGLMVSQERERQLQNAACRDYLTGLLNRRGFHMEIEALRQEDMPLAVYLFDLDNLKKINDCYGHEAGDQMLKAFGELLRSHTRDGDILSRYGGDEFLVVLKRIPSELVAQKKGDEICRAFNACQLPGDARAACSAGIAMCSFDEKPSMNLVKQADQALYRAKLENKGGCCMWDGKAV